MKQKYEWIKMNKHEKTFKLIYNVRDAWKHQVKDNRKIRSPPAG